MSDVIAWTWQQPGEPSDLRLEPQSIPILKPEELLIANSAIGLNPADWKLLQRGHPEWKPGHIPGLDGVGTVVEKGSRAQLRLGERVAYHQYLRWNGSFASYTRISERAAIRLPENLSDAIAATLPCPGLTAWQAIEKVPFPTDRDLLISGASGSVGSFLVQLALAKGCRVWVTARAVHHARLKEFGVQGTVDYTASEWRTDLKSALGDRKLWAVLDTVDADEVASLAPLIAYNGHVVCIQGRLSQPLGPPFTQAISQHEVALNAVYQHGTELDFAALRTAGARLSASLADGYLKPPPFQTVRFQDLPQILADVKASTGPGKYVVLLP